MFLKRERFPKSYVNEGGKASPADHNFRNSYQPKVCRAPFNSSAPAPALDVESKKYVPAPCTYTVTFRKHRIKGGASLQYTAPAAREYFAPSTDASENFISSRRPLRPVTSTFHGKLFRGKPPRYNYNDISDDVQYTKLASSLNVRPKVSDKPRIVEPLYYTFPFELSSTNKRYKGIHWGMMRSDRRPLLAGEPTSPGVGAYDLLDKPTAPFDIYCSQIRFNNRKKAKSLRTLDLHCLQLKLLDEPGPADYDVVSKDYMGRYIFDSGTFFKAERKTFELKDVPQSDINPQDIYKRKSSQKCWPPFNSSSKRRKSLKADKTSPADLLLWNHTLFYKLARELSFPRIVAPFNSSAERICQFSTTNDNPEPSAYDIDRFPFKPKSRVFGAKDASNYEPPLKLAPIKSFRKREIAPGSYEVESSYKRMRGRRDFQRGQGWQRKKTDRLSWLVNKDSPDVLYTVSGGKTCPRRRRPGTSHHPGPCSPRKRKVFRPPKIADYYNNRLSRRVKMLVSNGACRGITEPFLRHAVSSESQPALVIL